MIASQLFDLSAGIGAAVDQTKQLADLLDRETEIAAAPDKVYAPYQTLPIEAVPIRYYERVGLLPLVRAASAPRVSGVPVEEASPFRAAIGENWRRNVKIPLEAV